MELLRGKRNDIMVNYFFQQAVQKSLISQELWQGVVLKKARGDYACHPPQLKVMENGLYDMVSKMNIRFAMTVCTPVTRTILDSMAMVDLDFVPVPDGLRVQILKPMMDLPQCKLHHFAAFVEDLKTLVVWDDEVDHLLQRAEDLETGFVKLIWAPSDGLDDGDEERPLKNSDDTPLEEKPADCDPESLADSGQEKRPARILQATMSGLTLLLVTICLGVGWKMLVLEIRADGKWLRIRLIAMTPVQVFISLVSQISAHERGSTIYLEVKMILTTNTVLFPSSGGQPTDNGWPHQSHSR